MAWLADYSYRKSITLSRASGAVTNHQMKLLVGESSGATGETVDCGGHCATDFDDIRFTTSDGETLLDYWIESVSGATPNQLATIWIEFDSIGTGATTFYMYYGNAGAAAYSNGANTFPSFFEDWAAGTLDTGKWTTPTTYAINAGVMELGAGDSNFLFSQNTLDVTALIIRARSKVSNYTIGSSPQIAGFSTAKSSTSGTYQASQAWASSDAKMKNIRQGTHETNVDVSSVANNNEYYISEIYKSGSTNYLALVDNAGTAGSCSSSTDSTTTADNYILFNSRNSLTVYNDWILVRKYLATEPAWGSWGGEETTNWLTDYTYRKSITLSRASGAVTNYQMMLLVGESSGATGETVDCGGHCLSTFDDIRFTTSDGETLLDYWIESISGATPNQLATIWIEFDSIGTGATTFYMYYGNAEAVAASSGANTFPFFDDFPGSSLDGGKWTSSGSVTVSGGTATILRTGGANAYIASVSNVGVDLAIRSRIQTAHWNTTSYEESIVVGTDWNNMIDVFFCAGSGWATKIRSALSGTATSYTSTGWAAATYGIVELRRRGTPGIELYYNDASGATAITTNKYVGSNTLYFNANTANDSSIIVDWVLTRQFLDTEPAWGSWGGEEETEEPTEFTELEDAALYLTTITRAPVRVTSAPLEIISDDPVSHNIRVTSAPLEIISDDPVSHNIRVTSAVIEIISTEYVVSVADDARLELSAYYQELEDALLYLQAAASAPLEDSKLWLRAHDGTEFNDALMYLYTRGYEYDDALMYLTVGSYEYDDAALYLSVTDAITYDNAALYLYVTDGIARSDCRMYLTAVADVPAAASSVYQRLTSIISEV